MASVGDDISTSLSSACGGVRISSSSRCLNGVTTAFLVAEPPAELVAAQPPPLLAANFLLVSAWSLAMDASDEKSSVMDR